MKNYLLLYFPLDDPIVKSPFELIDIYIKHGVRTIEIALPTKNPKFDGQTIKQSMARVLRHKNLIEYFDDIEAITNQYKTLKIQLMAYYHIIEEIGIDYFIELVVQSKVSYVLTPDASIEQFEELENRLMSYGIHLIRIAPYELSNDDIPMFENSKGYIFQRSTDGKTGGVNKITPQIKKNIKKFRSNNIFTPIVVAFGISSQEQVEMVMSMGADGVAIGSALFNPIIKDEVDKYLTQFDKWFVEQNNN